MLTRSRKAFTLLELIVVIVILGILAALAIPTFAAVITKAQQSNVDRAAESLAREIDALAAFDRAAPAPATSSYAADGIDNLEDADVNNELTITTSGNDITVTDTNGNSATVTLSTTSGAASSVS